MKTAFFKPMETLTGCQGISQRVGKGRPVLSISQGLDGCFKDFCLRISEIIAKGAIGGEQTSLMRDNHHSDGGIS